jgi:hypothetical protein
VENKKPGPRQEFLSIDLLVGLEVQNPDFLNAYKIRKTFSGIYAP